MSFDAFGCCQSCGDEEMLRAVPANGAVVRLLCSGCVEQTEADERVYDATPIVPPRRRFLSMAAILILLAAALLVVITLVDTLRR